MSSVDPVDRNSPSPEVIILTASAALPVRAKTEPCANLPNAFQNNEPFSSASATSSFSKASAEA
jgi:hypothetical protein